MCTNSRWAAEEALKDRVAELERQLAEEKKDFNALADQYHRLGEKYEINPPLVVIVRSTQSELYDRALKAYNLLDTRRTERCKLTPENEAWFELYWCLINLKPKESADAPQSHN